jgi:hypothetical protein
MPANPNPIYNGIGVPSEIDAYINYLKNLFKHLPDALPLDPEKSDYSFSVDPDNVQSEGLWYALNQNLEICFKTHLLCGTNISIME